MVCGLRTACNQNSVCNAAVSMSLSAAAISIRPSTANGSSPCSRALPIAATIASTRPAARCDISSLNSCSLPEKFE